MSRFSPTVQVQPFTGFQDAIRMFEQAREEKRQQGIQDAELAQHGIYKGTAPQPDQPSQYNVTPGGGDPQMGGGFRDKLASFLHMGQQAPTTQQNMSALQSGMGAMATDAANENINTINQRMTGAPASVPKPSAPGAFNPLSASFEPVTPRYKQVGDYYVDQQPLQFQKMLQQAQLGNIQSEIGARNSEVDMRNNTLLMSQAKIPQRLAALKALPQYKDATDLQLAGIANDDRAFAAALKPTTPRNIDPLSPEGLRARQQIDESVHQANRRFDVNNPVRGEGQGQTTPDPYDKFANPYITTRLSHLTAPTHNKFGPDTPGMDFQSAYDQAAKEAKQRWPKWQGGTAPPAPSGDGAGTGDSGNIDLNTPKIPTGLTHQDIDGQLRQALLRGVNPQSAAARAQQLHAQLLKQSGGRQ